MPVILACAVVANPIIAPPALAKGCIKGAVVGGVAGHHAMLGAVSGCVIGHHIATKAAREKAQQHPTSSADYSDTPNSTH